MAGQEGMYFGPTSYLFLSDNANMPSSSSWAIEAWIKPIADETITTEQMIFSFMRSGESSPYLEAFLGAGCKCVTVRLNSDPSHATSSASVANLDRAWFLGISVKEDNGNSEVILDFGAS